MDHCVFIQANDKQMLGALVAEYAPYLAIGAKHQYNGMSLALASKIIEQVTGEAMPAFYEKHLLQHCPELVIDCFLRCAEAFADRELLAHTERLLLLLLQRDPSNAHLKSAQDRVRQLMARFESTSGPATSMTSAAATTRAVTNNSQMTNQTQAAPRPAGAAFFTAGIASAGTASAGTASAGAWGASTAASGTRNACWCGITWASVCPAGGR